MALDTYSDLQSEIADWLKNSALASKAATFVRLIEAQWNRDLRHPDMDAFTTLSVTTNTVTLPSDFLEIKSIWTGVYPPLDPMTIYDLQATYAPVEQSVEAQYLRNYAIVGGTLHFGLTPNATASFSLNYYQKIPALSSNNPTNWVLSDHPDAYLWGSLLMAEAYGWNDERLPTISAAYETALASIQASGVKRRYGGGPVTPRAAPRQIYGARS